jgi:hypothetical protein
MHTITNFQLDVEVAVNQYYLNSCVGRFLAAHVSDHYA